MTNILGVDYLHKKASDGGDLYLTRFGLQSARILEIEKWYEKNCASDLKSGIFYSSKRGKVDNSGKKLI